MICIRSLCLIFRSLTIRNVENTMPNVSIIHLPTHPVRAHTHSQNNESPPILDILVTRTLHHVCARRTQRSLVAERQCRWNSAHKNGVLQLSTQHNGKKTPQHNTITTLRRCSDVSITNVLAHKIPDQIQSPHATSDTEHRHHWNCPSRAHPKCDSWLNNNTQDCEYFTRCGGEMKLSTKSHNKLSFSDVGTNENNRNWNNTTQPGLLAKSSSTRTHHEFVNVKLKSYNDTTQRHHAKMCPSNAHGFCVRSFEEQRVTSNTGNAHQRNRPCVPKRQTECDSWARLFAHTQHSPITLAQTIRWIISIVDQIMQNASMLSLMSASSMTNIINITWHNNTRPIPAAKSPIIHIKRAFE